MIAQYHSQNNPAKMKSMLKFSARLIALVTLLLVIGLMALSPIALGLFGEDFLAGSSALYILLAAMIINALTGPVGYVMTMTGHHLKAAKILLAMIILNILLNVMLIPPYGIEGAAIATGVTSALWNIILSWYAITKLKLNPTLIPFKIKTI